MADDHASLELAPAATDALASMVRKQIPGEVTYEALFSAREHLKPLSNRILMLLIETRGWDEERLDIDTALRRLAEERIAAADRARVFDALVVLVRGQSYGERHLRNHAEALGVPLGDGWTPGLLETGEKDNGLFSRTVGKFLPSRKGEGTEPPLMSLARRYPSQLDHLAKLHAGEATSADMRASLTTAHQSMVEDIYHHYGRPEHLRNFMEITSRFRHFAEEMAKSEGGMEGGDDAIRAGKLKRALERIEQQEKDFEADLERCIQECLAEFEESMTTSGKLHSAPLQAGDWHDDAVWEEYFRETLEPMLKAKVAALREDYNSRIRHLKRDLEEYAETQPRRLNKWDTALNEFEGDMRNEIRQSGDAERKLAMYESLDDFKRLVRSMGREGKPPLALFTAPVVFGGMTPQALEGLLKPPGRIYGVRSALYRACLVVNFGILLTGGVFVGVFGVEGLRGALRTAGAWMPLGSALAPLGLAIILGATVAGAAMFHPHWEKRRLKNAMLQGLRKQLRSVLSLEKSQHQDAMLLFRRKFAECNASFFSPMLDLAGFLDGCLARQLAGLRSALAQVQKDFVEALK